MKRIGGVIWKFLISRDVAIILLAVVTIMLAIGAWLPNPSLMSPEDGERLRTLYPVFYWLGDRYNSQKLASGYVFGFVGVLLIISTTICSIDRILKLFGTKGRPDFYPRAGGSISRTVMVRKDRDISVVEEDLVSWLRKRRFRHLVERGGGGTKIMGMRGNIGFWGSILFHCILITALFGLVAYYLAGYRAQLIFTEGQSYGLEKERFIYIEREPLWGMRLPDVEMSLLSQYSIYDPDDPLYPLDHVARLRVAYRDPGKTFEKEVRINDPLLIEGRKFLLIKGGFSPRVHMTDESGNTIVDKYVALSNEDGTSDTFEIADRHMLIKAKLYPDKVEDDGKIYSKSNQLRNPYIALKVSRKGNYLLNEMIPLGKEISGGGYTITFPEVRRWVMLEMVEEPGIGFFFMISFAGMAGIMIRILDPEERVYFDLTNTEGRCSLEISAFSKHYNGLLEEKIGMIADDMNGTKG